MTELRLVTHNDNVMTVLALDAHVSNALLFVWTRLLRAHGRPIQNVDARPIQLAVQFKFDARSKRSPVLVQMFISCPLAYGW